MHGIPSSFGHLFWSQRYRDADLWLVEPKNGLQQVYFSRIVNSTYAQCQQRRRDPGACSANGLLADMKCPTTLMNGY
jgi:hypothetical protein